MIQEKYTLMRQKTKILMAVICMLFVYSCKSQEKENPETLGNQTFHLEKMTFRENPLVLFGKNKYYRTSIKDDQNRDIAYNYIISKKENVPVKVSFGNRDVSKNRFDFKADRNNQLIGASVSFTSKENVKESIIKDLDNMFGKYHVELNQPYQDPAVYRWETPEKIIQFSYSHFEGDHIYNISIVSSKYDCSRFPLEKIFIGEDICLKNYTKK